MLMRLNGGSPPIALTGHEGLAASAEMAIHLAELAGWPEHNAPFLMLGTVYARWGLTT